MAKEKSNYNAQDIEVLEGLEPVRKRPGMYIGGTEGPQGLHHLIKEILDNSIDEAMNGHATKILVTLHKNQESVTIEDNGRGIPVDIHPKFKKSALELVLTTLHAGGKFSERNYASAGGLHGVGASVVNALSEKLLATIWRDGNEWKQEFSQGKPKSKIVKGDKTKKRGTRIFFRPDPEIFRNITFDRARIEKLVQEKAFLNRGLSLDFLDEKSDERKTFCYEDGIQSYLRQQLEQNGQTALVNEQFYFEKPDGIKVQVAFCWTEGTTENIRSYVNGIHTAEGGSHEDGFKSGVAKALRNYMSVHELVQKQFKITSEDIREGLFGILSVTVPGATSQLQFQGQTKDKLNNPEVEIPVDNLLKSFENVLNSKPKTAQAIVERIINACRARTAARLAAEGVSRKVGVSHRLNLPGKLADCSSSRADQCEMFIVEGDSAGGSAKQGRDREIQAVLPLRGKVLNTISSAAGKLEDNKELNDLVSALGAGFGSAMRLDKLRYHKVIILTDADADGMHIASLLLAFFFKFMRPLIKAGHLYIGLSPLYRIRFGSGTREDVHWVYSDVEKEQLLNKRGRSALHITRFKGLGEMNPKTLWETTLNPKTRALLRITAHDEVLVQETLERLMGKDSNERFKLIQEHAHHLEADI